MKRLLSLLSVLAAFVVPHVSNAAYSNVFGLGAESISRGGTSLTFGDPSPFAAYSNPASLGYLDRPELSVGMLVTDVTLRPFGRVVINETGTNGNFDSTGVLGGRGQMIGIGIPLGNRTHPLTVGVAAYLSGESLSRVSGPPINNPYYPVYQDVTRNAAYTVSVGYRIWRGLALGVAGNTSMLSLADYRLVNTSSGASFSASTIEVKSVFSSSFSAAYDFSRDGGTLPLVVGASRRGKSELKTKLTANIEVQGVPVLGELTSYPHFSPAEWNIAGSYGISPATTLSADLSRVEWSDYKNPFGAGNINSFLFGGNNENAGFHDIWVPRVGAEHRIAASGFVRQYAISAGYFYHPSPVPAQTANSNFADSNRHGISAGLGLGIANPWTTERSLIRVDVFAQANLITRRQVTKNAATNLGAPGYIVGGNIWLYGVSGSLAF